jgi:uracil-DNA glycosylase
VITKWVVITLGGYVWKRHTYAAAASYPWSVGHHKMRSEQTYPNYT